MYDHLRSSSKQHSVLVYIAKSEPTFQSLHSLERNGNCKSYHNRTRKYSKPEINIIYARVPGERVMIKNNVLLLRQDKIHGALSAR